MKPFRVKSVERDEEEVKKKKKEKERQLASKNNFGFVECIDSEGKRQK